MRLPALNLYYTKPCAIMALATFTKPAMFAPVQNRKSVKKKSAAADFFRIIEKTHSPRDWRVAAEQAPALNYITPVPAQSLRWQPLRNRRCLRLCKIENPLRKSLRQRTFLGLSKKRTCHETGEWRQEQAPALNLYYTKPCAIIALATFTKPAMFAPAT